MQESVGVGGLWYDKSDQKRSYANMIQEFSPVTSGTKMLESLDIVRALLCSCSGKTLTCNIWYH
jgi:hypothetical protein